MALRNILKDNDPGLRKKSRAVKDFNKRLHVLLDDMRETMLSANGLGLAAPQVGVLRRVALIVDLPPATESEPDDEQSSIRAAGDADGELEIIDGFDEETDDEPEEDLKVIELINPQLTCTDGEQTGSEGCLSFPGMFGLVTRPQTVKVKAHDRFGEEFEIEVSGMTARAACHEIDHLDGILFTTIAERMLDDEELEEMRNNR